MSIYFCALCNQSLMQSYQQKYIVYISQIYASISDGIPPDGTPIQIIHSYKVGLTATYYTLALAGVTLAIVCMAFNFIFREKK